MNEIYIAFWIAALMCFHPLKPPAHRAPAVSYRVETINTPKGVVAETGAIDFMPDGRLVACFLRGEIMLYDMRSKVWTPFASGLHEPLGVLPINNSELLIMQRPELTRLIDVNGDGRADKFETVTDEFGLSGNYHEFNYGPVSDSVGNLFIALNSASGAGGVRPEVRGRYDSAGKGPGKTMFSTVPFRGWIMKLDKKGILHPYATGLRSPNGLGFDLQGHLFATENQGDWVGTSALYHILEGNFYGHPAGLIWKKGWNKGNPFFLPVEELDRMRIPAAVLFPQDVIANSPSQPVCDMTAGKFGPFAGQLFVGEMNSPRIVRVMLEKIGGQLQGACIPFLEGQGLRKGNNRLAFANDGSLWVGQAAYGWAGDNGIQRIVFTGKQPMDVYTMNLTHDGFNITFTQPVDRVCATDTAQYYFTRYNYAYHEKYGSPQMDKKSVPVKEVSLSADQKTVSLILDTLQEGYVYQLDLGNLPARSGDSLLNRTVCYTINRLLQY